MKDRVHLDRKRTGVVATLRWQWDELAEIAAYDVSAFARLCGLSRRHLQREFRRHLARSPKEWLCERRILAAQQRLLSGEPLKKVAYDLGFKQVSHFSRHFKLFSGRTASEFIAFHRQPPVVAHLDNKRRVPIMVDR